MTQVYDANSIEYSDFKPQGDGIISVEFISYVSGRTVIRAAHAWSSGFRPPCVLRYAKVNVAAGGLTWIYT
jgi:hypothetical protein